MDADTKKDIEAQMRRFTIPSALYESIYPDVISMSYDIESVLADAKNQIDLAFSQFKNADEQKQDSTFLA